MRDRPAGVRHLAVARRAPELFGQLDDLGRPRRADGVALRLQPARGIDRHVAVEACPAVGSGRTALAALKEAQRLGRQDLRAGKAVVDLGEVEVGG